MKVLITGVAGFIGSHAGQRFLADGHTVVGIDNLSRPGAQVNLVRLREMDGDFHFAYADIRNRNDVMQVFSEFPEVDVVLHLAAQVAVTTSVVQPFLDFETNALGTVNLLEATRHLSPKAAFLFASTNKVYGNIEQLPVRERSGRYEYVGQPDGVSEDVPLDFHSPYGCSKGAADQYVRDYSRIFGLRTVVFRQSCIYGTHQFGVEDQGWVAWFAIASVLGKTITIYGDGKQVRDVLWVDDLVDLYLRAIDRIDVASGRTYNAGGGPKNSLSILELVDKLSDTLGQRVDYRFSEWRPGDQKVFMADCSRAASELGWVPRMSPDEGVSMLIEWVRQSESLLRSFNL